MFEIQFAGKISASFYLNMFVKQHGFHLFYHIAERTLQHISCWKTFGGFRPQRRPGSWSASISSYAGHCHIMGTFTIYRNFLVIQLNFYLSTYLVLWFFLFCRSAMFHGQVESPAKGLWSFLDHPDSFVLVAINSHSLHVIDYYRNVSSNFTVKIFDV